MVEKNRLFTPGPTSMFAHTLEIGSSQLPYNRTDQFSQITLEIIDGLKYVFGTQEDVVIFSSSGTGAMEAAVINFLNKNDRVLIINGGTFGERWVELCTVHGIPYDEMKLEPGQSPLLENLDYKLSNKKYSALLINAHETSTGVLYDTKAIGRITHKYNILFIVDAISTICADTFLMDKWHVDVAVLSSQKALALPPGISFLALNQNAKEKLKEKTSRSYYFDISEYLDNQDRGQMPFTPAIGIFMMLHERLQNIQELGIESAITQHIKISNHFREGIKKLSFSIFPNTPSNALTSIKCHKGINAFELVKKLSEDFNCIVAPCAGDLKQDVFRVSHSGDQSFKDVNFLLYAIKNCLKQYSPNTNIKKSKEG